MSAQTETLENKTLTASMLKKLLCGLSKVQCLMFQPVTTLYSSRVTTPTAYLAYALRAAHRMGMRCAVPTRQHRTPSCRVRVRSNQNESPSAVALGLAPSSRMPSTARPQPLVSATSTGVLARNVYVRSRNSNRYMHIDVMRMYTV